MKELTTKERESLKRIIAYSGNCDIIDVSCNDCLICDICHWKDVMNDTLEKAKQKLKGCDDMTDVENICNEVVKRVIKEHPEWVKKEQPKVPFHVGGVYIYTSKYSVSKYVLRVWYDKYTLWNDNGKSRAQGEFFKNDMQEKLNSGGWEYAGQLSDIIAEALK